MLIPWMFWCMGLLFLSADFYYSDFFGLSRVIRIGLGILSVYLAFKTARLLAKKFFHT
jgi:hypothetical protein